MDNVLIIGGGEIGQAIRILLNETPSQIFDSDKQKTEVEDPQSAIERAQAVFICTPSKSIPELHPLLEKVSENTPIIFLTKGIDVSKNAFLYELYSTKNIYFLYGPMIAEDIKAGYPTQAILTGKQQNPALENILNGKDFSTIYSSDVIGVCISGILKNIYTLFLSGLANLHGGTNMQGVFLTKVIAEGCAILKDAGGDAQTFLSLAGLGDLIATSQSPYSTHAKTGEILTQQSPQLPNTEGIRSLPILITKLPQTYPILSFIKEVIADKKPFTDEKVRKLLTSL